MKKYFLMFILLAMVICLSSCSLSNKYTTYESGIDITIDDVNKAHFLKNEFPILHFDMKNVNVSTMSTNQSVIFVKNDNYLLSDAFAKHIQSVENNLIVLDQIEQTNDSKNVKFGKDKLTLDEVDESGDPQKHSIEKRVVTWQNDGTRYSYQYRTFVSNKKRYYIYCYTNNIQIVIETPVMVITKDSENKLLLLPLPYDTLYEVGLSNLKLEALIEKDTYLDQRYYSFSYPSYLDSYLEEEKKDYVKAWYDKYTKTEVINGDYYVNYYGNKFKIEFDIDKYNNSTNTITKGFKLIYSGNAS